MTIDHNHLQFCSAYDFNIRLYVLMIGFGSNYNADSWSFHFWRDRLDLVESILSLSTIDIYLLMIEKSWYINGCFRSRVQLWWSFILSLPIIVQVKKISCLHFCWIMYYICIVNVTVVKICGFIVHLWNDISVTIEYSEYAFQCRNGSIVKSAFFRVTIWILRTRYYLYYKFAELLSSIESWIFIRKVAK